MNKGTWFNREEIQDLEIDEEVKIFKIKIKKQMSLYFVKYSVVKILKYFGEYLEIEKR